MTALIRICIPVTSEGLVGHSWGRAPRVAVADVKDGSVLAWEEIDVAWDRLHDETTEGGHHARVARFLRDHHVETVAAGHMGQPMVHTLERLGIAVRLGVDGDARQAAIAAAGPTPA
jgi:predicted Fe-Mo cluster-binding NifX family protein